MSKPAPAAKRDIQAVLWIGHDEARVFHFNGSHHKETIHPDHPARRVQNRPKPRTAAEAGGDQKYLGHVAAAVADAHEILVVGPDRAKSDFVAFLRTHDPRRPRAWSASK